MTYKDSYAIEKSNQPTNRLSSLALLCQPFEKNENSKVKPTVLYLKTDFVLYPNQSGWLHIFVMGHKNCII